MGETDFEYFNTCSYYLYACAGLENCLFIKNVHRKCRQRNGKSILELTPGMKEFKRLILKLLPFWQTLSWITISKPWSWKSSTLTTWRKESTQWKRPWSWERLWDGGEQGNRGWDGWMASPTQWTWVWENSGKQWSTGKPGMLQTMGSQRVGHDLATEQQQYPFIWRKIYNNGTI